MILLFNMNAEPIYVDTPNSGFLARGGALPINFSAFAHLNSDELSLFRISAMLALGTTYKGHNSLLGDLTKLDPQPVSAPCGTNQLCSEMNTQRPYHFENNSTNSGDQNFVTLFREEFYHIRLVVYPEFKFRHDTQQCRIYGCGYVAWVICAINNETESNTQNISISVCTSHLTRH